MSTLRVLFLLGSLCASTAAQQPTPCKQIAVPATVVTVFNTTDLTSKTSKEGQEIELRVDREIRIGECLLFAKGAPARGHVTTVNEAKSFGRSGKLEIAIDDIQTVAVLGSTMARGSSGGELMKEALSVPGGAGILLAPVLFPMRGGHAEIPAGTAFEVHLPAELILDGIPAEQPSGTDAHLVIFRTPNDSGPICIPKSLWCFGAGRYMEIILSPGKYKLDRFGPLEVHVGDRIYLRQILALLKEKTTLVQTGGGIFEFFLPQMKPIEATTAEKWRKSDIKGPIAE